MSTGRELINIIFEEDLDKIKEALLKFPEQINHPIPHSGHHVLAGLASSATLALIKLLVEHGAHVGQADSFGITALHLASGRERLGDDNEKETLSIVEYLIEKGANPVALDTLDGSPLWFAARAGQAEVIKVLVKHGADVHEKSVGGQSLLHRAIFSFDLKTVQTLVELGVDIHLKDPDGRSALKIAKLWKQKNIADYLEKVAVVQKEQKALKRMVEKSSKQKTLKTISKEIKGRGAGLGSDAGAMDADDLASDTHKKPKIRI